MRRSELSDPCAVWVTEKPRGHKFWVTGSRYARVTRGPPVSTERAGSTGSLPRTLDPCRTGEGRRPTQPPPLGVRSLRNQHQDGRGRGEERPRRSSIPATWSSRWLRWPSPGGCLPPFWSASGSFVCSHRCPGDGGERLNQVPRSASTRAISLKVARAPLGSPETPHSGAGEDCWQVNRP